MILETDTFGANDIAFDVNREVGSNIALRINFHSDTLENHRDHYEGDRIGFNPTLKVEISSRYNLRSFI